MAVSTDKKLSKEVRDFKLELDCATLALPSNPTEKDKHRLEGKLTLDLLSKLTGVNQIQFRFVGGIVISSKLEKEGLSFYGTERLFDQTVVLSDQKEFEAQLHEFPFFLALPSGSPPSLNHPNIKIQYLVVAVVGFDNGCCGLIPVLQKHPVRVKRDVSVQNYGIHSSFESRVNQEEGEMKMKLLDDLIIWTPNDNLLVKIRPTQSSYQQPWDIICLMNVGYVLDRVEYEITEEKRFKYS
jgi:hypothetical protein